MLTSTNKGGSRSSSTAAEIAPQTPVQFLTSPQVQKVENHRFIPGHYMLHVVETHAISSTYLYSETEIQNYSFINWDTQLVALKSEFNNQIGVVP